MGERERYIQLNAEFQRIAKRDKKAFLSEQCKEIEEKKKKRMGRTRDILKKVGDINGIFHDRMADKGQKWSRSRQKQRKLRVGIKNSQKNYTKKIIMTQISMMVWSIT